MTLREFIINESCSKKSYAKEFDDAPEQEDAKSGSFDFVVKVSVDAQSEDEAKDALKDALADFSGVKVKAAKKKAEKEEKPEEEADDDNEEDEQPQAAKGVCPQCGKKFSECTCGKEEVNESVIGAVAGIAALAGAVGLVASTVVDNFKAKKWREAQEKTKITRFASLEEFQDDKIISLIQVQQGEFITRIVPTKTLIEKYFDDEKHDFDGFIKEVRSLLKTRYEGLKKIVSEQNNKPLTKAVKKITAEFYCFAVDFTNDEKKEIKSALEDAVRGADFGKKTVVKVLVEKKK